MSDNIVNFPGITKAPEPPNQILEKAKDWDLARVLVVGANEAGDLVWGGSFSEAEDILWLLEMAKTELMREALDSS